MEAWNAHMVKDIKNTHGWRSLAQDIMKVARVAPSPVKAVGEAL